MQPYQEEYLANLQKIATLTGQPVPVESSFEDCRTQMSARNQTVAALSQRNMALLRQYLFPLLDDLLDADDVTLRELTDFADRLLRPQQELDAGLFCHIRQALLSLVRQRRDRSAIIRELYWLGMGRYSLCNRLVGLELCHIQKYMAQMRLCFTEAAAYLKYYDEIEDTETRGYILRSRANMALGQFHSPHEKILLVKKSLQIMQDKGYRQKAPDLPWALFTQRVHQQMASAISYSKEQVMSAQDMADIMESVYIVYQQRIQEAEAMQQQPPVRWAFPYYAIEYYCGLTTLDRLLTKLEGLMDAADPDDHTPEGLYALISVPAFYCQYLQQYPDRIPARREYLIELYQRILNCVEKVSANNENLFFYLRQLSHTFVEVEGGISYRDFLQKLLLRFAPEVYLHCQAVAAGAAALCALLLQEDAAFFDDIDFVRAIHDPAQKRQRVLAYATDCGSFHDVGKINFIELYCHNSRQWFEEEYETAQLHTIAGEALLAGRPSTSRYAAAALGHHAWYDGSHGYPQTYKRLSCPERQMVDVIGLVDWLENVTCAAQLYTGTHKSLPEAIREAISLEGKRFSPLLTGCLRQQATAGQLAAAFAAGRGRAEQTMYQDALRHRQTEQPENAE